MSPAAPRPLSALLPVLLQDPAISAAAQSAARSGAARTEDLEISLPDGGRPAVTALLAGAGRGNGGGDALHAETGQGLERPSVLLLVTATAREADDLAADLGCWICLLYTSPSPRD